MDWTLLRYFPEGQKMKRKTAVKRVWALVSTRKFIEADVLMRKYRRKFGHRQFNYWLRLNILNGLWELDCENE
jgi:hypothetical protein